jgi:hypothetical protein
MFFHSGNARGTADELQGFAIEHPRDHLSRSTSAARSGQPGYFAPAHGQQVNGRHWRPKPYPLSPDFPSDSSRAARLRLIYKTNRNPKPDKKILATKALDKVYIYYQSAMTPT